MAQTEPTRPSIRLPARLLAVSAGGLLLAAMQTNADAASLRSHTIVHGDMVRLGDLFDDAGAKSEALVLRAPAPGRKMTVEGRWLRSLARAYRLNWQPAPGIDQTIVERSSNPVEHTQILAAVRHALEHRAGQTGPFDVTLETPSLTIHLPIDTPASVSVRQLRLDKRSLRFTATLLAPADQPGARTVPIAGRVHPLVSVPVLARRLRSGDIIRKDDIKQQMMRRSRIGNTTVLDPEKIVGMGARRTLRIDMPVRRGDIREPVLVARHSLVIMKYQTANMVITAQGKARENGTRGETIRIQNTGSGKTIEGVVIGPGMVAVGTFGNIGAIATRQSR